MLQEVAQPTTTTDAPSGNGNNTLVGFCCRHPATGGRVQRKMRNGHPTGRDNGTEHRRAGLAGTLFCRAMESWALYKLILNYRKVGFFFVPAADFPFGTAGGVEEASATANGGTFWLKVFYAPNFCPDLNNIITEFKFRNHSTGRHRGGWKGARFASLCKNNSFTGTFCAAQFLLRLVPLVSWQAAAPEAEAPPPPIQLVTSPFPATQDLGPSLCSQLARPWLNPCHPPPPHHRYCCNRFSLGDAAVSFLPFASQNFWILFS